MPLQVTADREHEPIESVDCGETRPPDQAHTPVPSQAQKREFTGVMRAFHSWSGILFGWLLYTVFVTGTLTVFDGEISQWMQPELLEFSLRGPDFNRVESLLADLSSQPGQADAEAFSPTLIQPVKLQSNRTFAGQMIDPRTGEMVILRDTQGGDFFYHFHHGLLLGVPGAWIVSLGGIAMIVSLGTGVGIHRHGLKEVMLAKVRPVPHRALAKSHDAIGILALPFAVMITVTGVMISWSIYLPAAIQFVRDSPSILSLGSTLHFAQVGGTVVRWGYFLMGLAASAMIATGLISWTNKRRPTRPNLSQAPHQFLIERLTIATVAGLLCAVGGLFWANRTLPLALPERSFWEIRCFFFVWCLCVLHSLVRRHLFAAWREQLSAAALLLTFLPLLNAFTTNAALWVTIPQGRWAAAGMDLTSLAAGLSLGICAARVRPVGETSPD